MTKREKHYLAQRRRLADAVEEYRDSIDFYAERGNYYAGLLEQAEDELAAIEAERRALQFEMLLHLPYRRFCRIFNL